MLSKKNIQMMIRKGQPQKQRFGLRKLSIGVASVLLGLTFIGASSASADETVNQEGQAVQTELATPQPVEITGSESARQPDNDEVASSSTAEATPVSSEATSQVVADSAGAVQDQTPPSAQPVTSTAPEISGGGTVGSASDPASDIPQQNGVEIKFQDQDDHGNVLPDYVYIPGKKPGDKITMDEIIKHLPAGLEIVEGQPQEFEVTGEPYQSIPIYVRHIIEEKTESKDVEQIIYGHYGTNKEILNHQVVTFTRVVRYDKYTKQMVVVQEWQPSLTFQDYTVVPKDGFSANHSVIKGTTVDSNSGTVKIDVLMKKNIVNTETDTVTRTIILYLPDGTTREIVQTVKFTRDVITNPWTNEATYGEWTTDKDSFDSYQAGENDGIAPDRTEISQVTVKPGTNSWVEEIKYPQNEVITETRDVTRTIKLILPDGRIEYIRQTITFTRQVTKKANGEIVYGEWDQPGKMFDDYYPAEIDGKKSDKTYIPREVANPDTKDYEVEVRYEVAYSTATEEKVINRVIHLHHPNGTVETVKHSVTLTREVKTNLQTGEKEYGEWSTGQFAEFVVPTVEGHVPDIEKIELMEVNGTTEDQLHHVNYLAHQVDADTKTVNRLIQVTMPDGTVKTITQTVTFVKHTTKHPVNGEIISETEWQVVDGDGTWAEFIPEKVDGYTPSQEKVEAVTPNINTGNVLVEISYKQNEKPTDPVGPSEPTEPDTPVDPDKPITPDKPDNPTEPDKPVSPGQLGTSDGPVDSDKPAGSDGPTSSGNSDQQGNENSASATTNAANAAATATVQLTSATTVEQADVKEVDNNAKKAN
ncbi:YSIRK-type signal peptide-containing protein [Limosilactobacillus vaginalis]|uniref:mucin-binding protein n=1 Tax=Limosilactobacillus vaginalis TaxID=1633 RepID=UPI00361FC07B